MRVGGRELLRRVALLALFLLGAAGYFVTNRLGPDLPFAPRTVSWPLDAFVPLVPAFVVPYLLFLPYVAGTAAYLFLSPGDRFERFIGSTFLGMVVATAVFVVFPTTIDRPDPSGGDAFSFLLRVVYAADRPYDCLPSTHVFYSVVSCWHLYKAKPSARAFQAASVAFTLLVCASTVLVKQHHLPDIAAGLALALASVLAAELPKEALPWRKST